MSKELTDVEIQARDILNEISKEARLKSGGSESAYYRNYILGIDDKIFEINKKTPLTELLEKAYNDEMERNKDKLEEENNKNKSRDYDTNNSYCMHGFPENCCPSGCDEINYDDEDEDESLDEDLSLYFSEKERQDEMVRVERMGGSQLKNIGPVVNGFYRLNNLKNLHQNFTEGNFAPVPVFNEKQSTGDKKRYIPFNEMFDISYLFCGRTSSTSEQLTPNDFNPRIENISVEQFHLSKYLLMDFTVAPVFTIKDSVAEMLKIPKGIKMLPAISEAIDNDSQYIESMQLVMNDIEAEEKIIKTLERSLITSDEISQTPENINFNFTVFKTNIDEIKKLSHEIITGCGSYFQINIPAMLFVDLAKKECLSINSQIIEAIKAELPEKEKGSDIKISDKRKFANVFLFDEANCVDCINTMMLDNRNYFNHDGKGIFKEYFSGAGSHILELTTLTILANPNQEVDNKRKKRTLGENLEP